MFDAREKQHGPCIVHELRREAKEARVEALRKKEAEEKRKRDECQLLQEKLKDIGVVEKPPKLGSTDPFDHFRGECKRIEKQLERKKQNTVRKAKRGDTHTVFKTWSSLREQQQQTQQVDL